MRETIKHIFIFFSYRNSYTWERGFMPIPPLFYQLGTWMPKRRSVFLRVRCLIMTELGSEPTPSVCKFSVGFFLFHLSFPHIFTLWPPESLMYFSLRTHGPWFLICFPLPSSPTTFLIYILLSLIPRQLCPLILLLFSPSFSFLLIIRFQFKLSTAIEKLNLKEFLFSNSTKGVFHLSTAGLPTRLRM